jgi:hypothetical protein
MFGLFSRPVRRPRTIHRTPARTMLRVEALEARAIPDANPALANVTATWTSPTQVVISGTVTDISSPTTVLVGGAATGSAPTTPQGTFTIALNLDQPGGQVLLAAQPVQASAPTPVTIVAAGQPTLNNVTITQEDGIWHIRGQVNGMTPGQNLVISIISSIPSVNGQTQVVDNADGTFDIGISLPTGSPGGSISLILGDGNGNTFDEWDGSIG